MGVANSARCVASSCNAPQLRQRQSLQLLQGVGYGGLELLHALRDRRHLSYQPAHLVRERGLQLGTSLVRAPSFASLIHCKPRVLNRQRSSHRQPVEVVLLEHACHVGLDTVVLGGVFALQVQVEVHVVPHVVILVAVLVKTRAALRGQAYVFVSRAGDAADEARVGQRVCPLVGLLPKLRERVHDQTGDDVEEQDADPDEERQVEGDPGQELIVSVAHVVHHLRHARHGDALVKDEPEAAHHAVAPVRLLLVRQRVVVKPVFEPLHAELGVDDDGDNEGEEDDGKLLEGAADAEDDILQNT
mmetsp:Transcript_61382/g.123033  ORF Transcript_61382/g.123033 Transcript_61382/m.123033 type:complete len:302 (+) Transcript_61382:77-982(+)